MTNATKRVLMESGMSRCTHDLADQETACADGMCPYCLAGDVRRLRDALIEIDKIATAHKAGAIGKAQKVARAALTAG